MKETVLNHRTMNKFQKMMIESQDIKIEEITKDDDFFYENSAFLSKQIHNLE